MNTHLAAKKRKKKAKFEPGKKRLRVRAGVGVGVTLRGAGIFGTTAVAALLVVHYDLSLCPLSTGCGKIASKITKLIVHCSKRSEIITILHNKCLKIRESLKISMMIKECPLSVDNRKIM